MSAKSPKQATHAAAGQTDGLAAAVVEQQSIDCFVFVDVFIHQQTWTGCQIFELQFAGCSVCSIPHQHIFICVMLN